MKRLCWSKITSEVRIPEHKRNRDTLHFRSEIESDYLRIVKSASFRRLQDKTQVFPLDKSDFVRTRLTHSYEVSSIAKFIGRQVCSGIEAEKLECEEQLPNSQNVNEILNCAGLLHDIGNPPFGHFGETAIREWFRKNLDVLLFKGQALSHYLNERQQLDLKYFEGNAQALRITCKLHRLIGTNGMHLTSGVLDTIIKYPCTSEAMYRNSLLPKEKRNLLHKKIGYFESESELYDKIKQNTGTAGCRNPLTYILEAADDIAYTFADLEDGYKKGLYTYEELSETIRNAEDEVGVRLLEEYRKEGIQLTEKREAGFSAYKHAVFTWLTRKQLYCISTISDAFQKNYEAIMNGTFASELIRECSEKKVIQGLKELAYRKVYMSSSILKLELMGNEIISFLLDRFVQALIPYDTDQPMSEIDEKYISLLSGNYLDNYHRTVRSVHEENERLYHRLLLAADFISGMTDSYAKMLYRELRGIG